MKRIMTQKQRILRILRRKRWVKVQELNEIAWRYGAVLFELRKDGYVFQKRRQHDKPHLEEWSLVNKTC